MYKKKCKLCNVEFTKKPKAGLREWEKRVYCSKECYLKAPKEWKLNSGNFIKGGAVWNRGIKMNLSEETREALAGRIKKYILGETAEQRKNRTSKSIKTRSERGTTNNGRLGNFGEKDPMWKGEDANYNSKHRWIQNHWVRAGVCEICEEKPVAKKVTRLKNLTHWHNISGKYSRERNDWLELCPSCHIKIHRNKLSI